MTAGLAATAFPAVPGRGHLTSYAKGCKGYLDDPEMTASPRDAEASGFQFDD